MNPRTLLTIPKEAIAGIAAAVITIIGIVAGVTTSQQEAKEAPIHEDSAYTVVDEYTITYPASYTDCSEPVQDVKETASEVVIRWGYVSTNNGMMCSMGMNEHTGRVELDKPLGDRTVDVIFDMDYFRQ